MLVIIKKKVVKIGISEGAVMSQILNRGDTSPVVPHPAAAPMLFGLKDGKPTNSLGPPDWEGNSDEKALFRWSWSFR